MNQFLADVVRWTADYFSWVSLPVAIVTTVVAIGIPLLHAAGGKRGKWTDPGRVLFGYMALIPIGLIASALLGIVTQEVSPEKFEAWQFSSNSEYSFDPVMLLGSFLIAMPLAFAVSSLVYGMLGGWAKFALSLLGIPVAIGMAGTLIVGLIFVACYAWNSCI